MTLPKKLVLCLDFDGVINSYSSGWSGGALDDPPVAGAIEALLGYLERFCVCIHSSRFNSQNHAQESVAKWLIKHGVPAGKIHWFADDSYDESKINLVATKPPAFVTLDDRAITFDGTFPPAETLLAFRPWTKKKGV